VRSRSFDAIVNALLYEGYILYPYRSSSVKNHKRFTFGGLYPKAWSLACAGAEPWSMQTECLVRGASNTMVDVTIRFLHLIERVDEAVTWQEATEREVAASSIRLRDCVDRTEVVSFAFPAESVSAGPIVRRREAICGTVEVSVAQIGFEAFRVSVRIANLTPSADGADRESSLSALMRSLASTHTLLQLSGGAFESLLDPGEEMRDAAAGCTNIGTWPVLVGKPGDRDLMLSSPIILYDYPCIAAESPGDLFDGTEIDEILTLRILTLTDDEKRAMRAVDPRARALLERTERLDASELMRLHGVLRAHAADGLAAGDHVRLQPRGGRDIFDLALAGKAATIASVEQDLEGRLYYAVTVDDDPGKDLGVLGKPGHRFFFTPEEVERLS